MIDRYALETGMQQLQAAALADTLETHFDLVLGRAKYRLSRHRVLNGSEQFIKDMLKVGSARFPSTPNRNPNTPAPDYLRLRVWLDNNPQPADSFSLMSSDINFMMSYEDTTQQLQAHVETARHNLQRVKDVRKPYQKELNATRRKIHTFLFGTGKQGKQYAYELIGAYEVAAAQLRAYSTEEREFELQQAKSNLKAHTGWKKKAATARIKQAVCDAGI